MLRIKFESAGFGRAVEVGPAEHFRVGGNMMHIAGRKEPIAEFRNHGWAVEGSHHTRYVSLGRAVIRFENLLGDQTEPFGPFENFSASDGVLYGDDRLLAKFIEETQLWHCFPTDTYWPTILISDASGE